MTLKSIDPTTGHVMKEYPVISADEMFKEVADLRSQFAVWKDTSISERVKSIKKIEEVLLDNKDKYAAIISREVGRPIKDCVDEVSKCASVAKFYAEHASKFLEDEEVKTEAYKSYIHYEPIGVVFGIMPWNYPFWQAFRSIVPTLAAGNLYALKHASNVPDCALAIEEVMKKAGLGNYFKTLFIDIVHAQQLIESDLIQGVSVTGSTQAGKKIAELAGKHLKKVVLELGGSDAFIILEDADLDKAVKQYTESRFLNAGQSCNAAKRVIVVEKVADAFEQKVIEAVKHVTMGRPNENVTMGPLATENMQKDAERFVTDAKAKGAHVIIGGNKKEGYYFEPTVITHVTKDMLVANEETFCPLAVIIRVKDEYEAVAEANRSKFGLGCSIWSANLEKAEHLARQVEAGAVCVNKKVRSDPRLPFGGVKDSGLGRELGEAGIKEFVNIKSIVIEK